LQSLFPARDFPDLVVGLANPDDAAVYRLDAERALVVTNDFFTPIVDDPYDYGAIAAANSLSDVYSMGGTPILALTIAGFPLRMPEEILGEIMRGLGEKVREAGAAIAGGHTVQDKEPKLGLCVLGMAHPDRVLTKAGARPGDLLVLTKPLGTGVITTAAKADKAQPAHLAAAVESMKRLNRTPAEVAVALGLKAGTDITGFGLLGHASEMAEGGHVGFRIFADQVPYMEGVRTYAEQRLFPGGAGGNREAYSAVVRFDDDIRDEERMLMFDPQTSGGLLLAVPPAQRDEFAKRMTAANQACWFIGEVSAGSGITVQRRRE
jgi:selenide,water dikinase